MVLELVALLNNSLTLTPVKVSECQWLRLIFAVYNHPRAHCLFRLLHLQPVPLDHVSKACYVSFTSLRRLP